MTFFFLSQKGRALTPSPGGISLDNGFLSFPSNLKETGMRMIHTRTHERVGVPLSRHGCFLSDSAVFPYAVPGRAFPRHGKFPVPGLRVVAGSASAGRAPGATRAARANFEAN